MATATLYQFALCPFCNKVRAALDVKGIEYDMVEVAPRSKKELPPLPEGASKKVPVLQAGDVVVQDSTKILNYLEDNIPGKLSLRPTDESARKRVDEIEEWVDATFIEALPTVIYGTKKEAAQAAQIIAKTSNFTGMQKLSVKVMGSLIMRRISKRILARNERTDAHAWVRENVDQFAEWLGDQQYVTGDQPSLADVSMHGAMTCVKEFPIFEELVRDAKVADWYQRISDLRATNRAA